jgi:3'-phosphoadenosine 5'-phosphosulfate (PAPS) 3'-phosphatase
MIAVARGEAQVLLYHRASPHDFGIPQVIVEEAGGICTDLQGEPVSYHEEWNRVPWFLAFADLPSRNRFFEAYDQSDIDVD